MTFPIDSSGPGRPARRLGKSPGESRGAFSEHEVANLPVPAGPARTVPRTPANDTHAIFAAHLLGQDGQKRGLRAGPSLIDAARSLYNRTEWSGERDRRANKGGSAKTDV